MPTRQVHADVKSKWCKNMQVYVRWPNEEIFISSFLFHHPTCPPPSRAWSYGVAVRWWISHLISECFLCCRVSYVDLWGFYFLFMGRQISSFSVSSASRCGDVLFALKRSTQGSTFIPAWWKKTYKYQDGKGKLDMRYRHVLCPLKSLPTHPGSGVSWWKAFQVPVQNAGWWVHCFFITIETEIYLLAGLQFLPTSALQYGCACKSGRTS